MEKKKVHLICNAHLDPIWQWDWQEGAAAAISTFQSAVNLAEEFDYIFCHNEVTLYKYIEEYAPNLFKQIQDLVKAGKWHIMGGWYLQPDCTMPSGESFVRQLRVGHAYFKEKFGVEPTTAINFDPFGHTRGIVQILAKCGQDSYLSMRPSKSHLDLPDEQLWWIGFDGSKVKYNRLTSYGSALGDSLKKVKGDIEAYPHSVIACTWGVGNHGGGPSRKDLQDIKEYMKEAKQEGIEIIHSTPEAFFSEIEPTASFDKSLYLWAPGCYVTMSRLKRLHIALENQLMFAEKICSTATMNGLMEYPHAEIQVITEDLLNSEFHDVLPGSSIQSGEENGIKLLHHGLLEVEKIITRAFFALSKFEKPAQEGEYPIFVFNPHPYAYDTDVEFEFTLADQNWDSTKDSYISVYDNEGNLLTSQRIKEESNLSLDWRKRVIFKTTLKPMALNRYLVKTEFGAKYPPLKEEFIWQDDTKYVEIDRNTGLLKRFCYKGKEYIHDAFLPVVFDDNEDPWGMGMFQLKGLGKDKAPFALSKKPHGVFEGLASVEVIENGPVYLGIEAFFEKDNSKIRVEYRIYKERPYVDVNVNVFWQDINKILRLEIPVNVQGQYIGQTAFGTDTLFMDGTENTSHRFVAVRDGKECLAVFNNCNYGTRFENNTIYLSLLRGATYCAHPIAGQPLIPSKRFVKRIDQCEHAYSFRIAVVQENEMETMATEFNQRPFVQNVFPAKCEYIQEKMPVSAYVEDKNITLVTLKKSVDDQGYIARLINNSPDAATTVLHVGEKSIELSFGKYEVKTVICTDTLVECKEMLI